MYGQGAQDATLSVVANDHIPPDGQAQSVSVGLKGKLM